MAKSSMFEPVQVRHEIELVRGIQRVCTAETQINNQVKLAGVVAKICSSSPVKLNSTMVDRVANFFVCFRHCVIWAIRREAIVTLEPVSVYWCFVVLVRMSSRPVVEFDQHIKRFACVSQVASLVRFVMGIGAGHFVDELCNFHALNVNPNDLSMSHTVFEEASFFARVACHLRPSHVCILLPSPNHYRIYVVRFAV